MDDLKQLKLVKNIYIVMSLLFCVLGIFLMARPKSSVKMLCVLMGIMLILYGAIKISGYFTRDAFCLAFQFDLAFGILLMAVGVILIARKNFAVDLIFSVFGILILADALFKIQMSVDAKRFGLALWWQILLIALVTGVIGVLVFIRPFEAAAMMMVLFFRDSGSMRSLVARAGIRLKAWTMDFRKFTLFTASFQFSGSYSASKLGSKLNRNQ